MEFDHAVKVKFSPDSRSFITGLGIGNTIRAFKITKKDDSSVQIAPAALQDFPSVNWNRFLILKIKIFLLFVIFYYKTET